MPFSDDPGLQAALAASRQQAADATRSLRRLATQLAAERDRFKAESAQRGEALARQARAGELGAEEALTFLREVDAINQRRRQRVVELTRELLGDRPWPGSRVAVLGAAFKPDSDDVRDSPALNVAGRLHLFGAHVSVYDPRATDSSRALWPTLSYADSARTACAGAHVVLVLTEWQEFLDVDPDDLAEVVAARCVLDGRNCLDPARWRAAGWVYRGMGRP